jgi:hypothetical protein
MKLKQQSEKQRVKNLFYRFYFFIFLETGGKIKIVKCYMRIFCLSSVSLKVILIAHLFH